MCVCVMNVMWVSKCVYERVFFSVVNVCECYDYDVCECV